MEGEYLKGRQRNAIAARYESDLDEFITFLKHVIAEGCCQVYSPRPHGEVVASCTDTPLTCEEEIIKNLHFRLKAHECR